MKAALLRSLLLCTGLALMVWAVLPTAVTPAAAAPPLVVTETTTAEPPTPTSTPLPPSPTSSPIPSPTATEIGPAPSVEVPTETPEEPPPPKRSTPTPSPSPTDPSGEALVTPTPEGVTDPEADPAITKSVSPPRAQVGQRVVYTISVTNLGTAPATGVRVTDTLPAFVRPEGATASRGQTSVSGQTVEVLIGDLAPGETVTITIEATVVAPAPAANSNLATVTSDTPDANLDNNQASVPLDTEGPSSLPNTGADLGGATPLLALLLGLALIVASLFVTPGSARSRPRE